MVGIWVHVTGGRKLGTCGRDLGTGGILYSSGLGDSFLGSGYMRQMVKIWVQVVGIWVQVTGGRNFCTGD